MSRKVVVGVVVAAQLAVFGALLGRQAATWHHQGFSGVAYQPGSDADSEWPRFSTPFDPQPGRVIAVVPGSPGARAGVRDGDVVDAVNGVSASDLEGLRQLARHLVRGDTVRYELVRGGGTTAAEVTLASPWRMWPLVLSSGSTVGIGLAFVAISLLVAWSRPTSRSAMVFFAMSSVGAASFFLWALMELRFPDVRGVLPTGTEPAVFAVLFVYVVLCIALALLILHLALVFPRERPVVRRWPQVLSWLYTAPLLPSVMLAGWVGLAAASRHPWTLAAAEVLLAVVAVVCALRVVRRWRDGGLRRAVAASPWALPLLLVAVGSHLIFAARWIPEGAGFVLGLVFGLGFAATFLGTLGGYGVATCVALYRSYRESSADEKRQVRWPLWGTFTSIAASLVLMVLSVVLVSTHPSGLGSTVATAITAVSKLVYLLIPVSFAFAILRYRLLEIDILIRRTVVYGALTGAVVTSYLLFVGVGGLVVARLTGLEGQGVAVGATLVVAALLIPLRSRLQHFAERRLLRYERDLEAARQRISAAARTGTDRDRLLATAAEQVQQALAVRSVAILTGGRGPLQPEATVGLGERGTSALRVDPADPVLASRTRATGPGDWPADSAGRDALVAAGMMRFAAAPAGAPTAAVAVGSRFERQPFEPDDDVFLAAVADEVARGVARLESRRTEAELGQAGEIQRALLPTALPRIGGVEVAGRWRPAREVSGDAYDVIRLDGDRILLTIADVVGKGLPAALLMSSLQTAVRSVADAGTPPDRLVDRVRSVVTGNLTGGRFVTLCAVVVDRAAFEVRWCNAGHVPPVLVRADGRVERLETGGPAVARVFRELGYVAGAVPVAEHDRLLLCTDGVTEALDPSGEPFGDHRLEEAVRTGRTLPAQGLLDHVERAVLEHAGSRLDDDLTLVAAAIVPVAGG